MPVICTLWSEQYPSLWSSQELLWLPSLSLLLAKFSLQLPWAQPSTLRTPVSFTHVTSDEAGPLEFWHDPNLAQTSVFPRFLKQLLPSLFCFVLLLRQTGSHSIVSGI